MSAVAVALIPSKRMLEEIRDWLYGHVGMKVPGERILILVENKGYLGTFDTSWHDEGVRKFRIENGVVHEFLYETPSEPERHFAIQCGRKITELLHRGEIRQRPMPQKYHGHALYYELVPKPSKTKGLR
jgi:hypothetical protein